MRAGLWVLCLLAAVGCSSDDSGGKDKTQNPATGDGDNGDGDNTPDAGGTEEPDDDDPTIPVPGDGDQGDGDEVETCEDGTTRPCDCEDGMTQGQELCIQGTYTGSCGMCPCNAGATQTCFCEGGGLGFATCGANSMFGECVCEAGASCPEGFNCQDLSQLGMGEGAACVPAGGGGPGGFGIPPMCQTDAQCDEAGLPDAACAQISDLIPIKLCVQSCTLPAEPEPDAGPGPEPVVDAGT